MAEYLTPGVYIESVSGAPVLESASTSIGGFVGIAERGPINVPIFITSWNAYITNFAGGMTSPFIANSDLAYAVYGFFQNGGKKCYVVRTANEASATKSVVVFDFASAPANPPVITAKDEGSWGNELILNVSANADNPDNFDFKLYLGSATAGNLIETLEGLSNDTNSADYWVDNVNGNSKFIHAVSGELALPTANATFEQGLDGIESISTADWSTSLSSLDQVDDVSFLCMPGQTTTALNGALMTYCENRKDVFALVDLPSTTATATDAVTIRKNMSCDVGAVVYPWIKVSDPLSNTGQLRACPACGHVMGVYARIIAERGVWKAPAGTEATIRGAIETLVNLTTGDTDVLNPAGVITIVSKPNSGIVVWGARSLSSDSSMKYVSDVLLDVFIKKSIYQGTQQFVFEPNDAITWSKVRTTVQAFLDTLWRDGGLFGAEASEAYYVKCDEDLNTPDVRNQGRLICEVGYASKKPAEFVVFRVNHEVSGS